MSPVTEGHRSRWDTEKTFFSVSCPIERLPRDRLNAKHMELLDYWSSKCQNERIAGRTDIDPLDIPRLLPNILLWDVDGDDYVCRLAGSEVDLSMGVGMKGSRLSSIRCSLIADAQAEFHAVRDRGYASFVERTMGWLGKPYLFYRHLLLPLADEDGRIRHIVSLLTFHPLAEARAA